MDTIKVELFGNAPKIAKAIQTARNAAVTKASVLINGEAGVGKKTLARFIHQISHRSHQSLSFVDCSLSEKEVENQILGYREEATNRFVKGAIEKGHGGTVVLLNIDELNEGFQKKLYKVMGQLEDYDLDVRIISTTCKNLSKLVGTGRFYRGLYSIISSHSIHLTPLRERKEDLLFISEYLLQKRGASLDDSAREKMLGHYWTYNIQEIKSVIENSLSCSQSNMLGAEDLKIGDRKSQSFSQEDGDKEIQLMSLKEAEKLLIRKALVHTSENRTQAAKILGVSIRTLRNKINEYRNSGSSYFVNLR